MEYSLAVFGDYPFMINQSIPLNDHLMKVTRSPVPDLRQQLASSCDLIGIITNP